MTQNRLKQWWLASLAGRFIYGGRDRPPPPRSDDLKRLDFKTSTQSLGIRFNEKIRNVFRHRWIR